MIILPPNDKIRHHLFSKPINNLIFLETLGHSFVKI